MRHALGIALLLAGVVFAQEPAAPDRDTAAATGADTRVAVPRKEESQPPVPREPADERFVPSEDISEDLSASFPSDI